MRTTLILVLLISFTSTLFCQTNSNRSIKAQLTSLNSNWITNCVSEKHTDYPLLDEKNLIQLHLSLVEKKLREKNLDHLTTDQKENRNKSLNFLNKYWKSGKFPTNLYHKTRTPYFIDDYGVACAVGHLLLATNNEDIVNRIKTENNYAYINELEVIYPELNLWADHNGFEINELAWIQPCYCFTPIPPGTVKHVSCFGGYDGEFSPEINPDWPAPYVIKHYIWSHWSSNWEELFCGGCDLPAGDYKGEVIDVDGIIHESFVTLLQPDTLVSSISTTDDNGNCNGTASIAVSGGYEFATIQWDSITDYGSSNVENLCAGTYPITITDGGDCFYTFLDTVRIESFTSTQNYQNQRIDFFPNPTIDKFFIQFEDGFLVETNITIFDVNGAEIFSKNTFENLVEFDVSNLDSGIYLVEINRGGRNYSRVEKLVKNSR